MKQQLQKYETRTNQVLTQILNTQSHSPLYEALSYATLNPGKRLRPALIYAFAEAFKCPLEKVDSLAAAIELIHSYSLVHDDLPAMDDDDLRRGRPTCHIQFDEATAILVGDAQLTLAFAVISNDHHLNAEQKVSAIQILSAASGSLGMIAGQMIDIQSEGQLTSLENLKRMHLLKTGELIKAACLLGALLLDNDLERHTKIGLFGETIGLAFQVQDDILDIESTTETLGKPQGSDEKLSKSTYPKLMGLKQAKVYRDQLITEAQNLLLDLNLNSPFLMDLTHYIAQRQH
ncbi:polyprenyl synthetase family protein [Thiosulfativibrio zosterae]|uniref:(2E,6E)-farnesyl diphosphate synthase n=1 Tax=Thiosulfativibrio zosterae TaxID=2675053 RepID=A0A6F8PMJ0_9GAMM|nr:farnesyl diphosphate synthase [Thiosulfativibrio zosterae]BBP43288.1 (2E,6E)-farnesyl diphosphate synthase [Thiosulfativibrio zosterae]